MSALFAYTARSADGHFVAGSLEAESLASALAQLRARPLFVTSIAPNDSVQGVAGAALYAWPVAPRARVAFFRSFATLIRAGVPLRRSLDVTIAGCRDPRLREALGSIASEVEAGGELSAAMAHRPREFPRLFTAMIRAGEIGGALDAVLERLADLVERHHALRKRIQTTLTYPGIVALSALSLVLFLVVSCVPGFAATFAQMHVPLPPTTRWLIFMGTALQRPWVWMFFGLMPLGAAALWRGVHGNEALAIACDRAQLSVPFLGAMLRKATLARIARTLGTLLASGVPILTAIAAAEDVAENAHFRSRMRELAGSLSEGASMARGLAGDSIFDPLAVQLVRVGEETGSLDAMLLRVAEYYELDVETSLASLSSVIEPALIIVLGGVIGLIVASILLPLYSQEGWRAASRSF